MTESQEYYLLQVKLQQDGEWWSVRNQKGNIFVFLSEYEAKLYSTTEEYKRLNMSPVKARIVKNQVIQYAKEGSFL